jgi:exonuclease SbcC
MIIDRLSVSGFKIMGAPMTLQFPPEGKIGIIGANESGKSTLMEAIAFALYGLRRGTSPASEQRENLVTWGKENARLEIEFTSGEYRYILERRIGVKRGHSASLRTFEDGEAVGREANIQQIQEKIEQITGMDRDSFTKLVYIRQKDLDALKELGRARREQLVNKVMGMEVFDTSRNAVKKDLRELVSEKERRDRELEFAKIERDRHEESLERKKKLGKDLRLLEKEKKKLDRDLKKKSQELQRYEWLSEKVSTEMLLEEKKKRVARIEQQEIELAKTEERVRAQQKVIEEQEPVFKKLKEVIAEYRGYEERLKVHRSEIEEVRQKRTLEVQSLNLPEEEFNLLSSDLQSKKQRMLQTFIITGVGSALSLFIGGNLGIVFYFMAILLFGVFVFSLRNYLRLEKVVEKASTVQSLTGEIERRMVLFTQLKSEYEAAKRRGGYDSLEEAEETSKKLTVALKEQTDYESMEALRTAVSMDQRLSDKLRVETVSVEMLREELKQTQQQLNALVETRPKGVGKLKYSKEIHEQIKMDQGHLEEKESGVVADIASNEAKIGEIEKTLRDTKSSYEKYPSLKKEVGVFDARIRLLERVGVELGETSRGLRERVLPHAAYVINHILPDITDGRYSDLKIGEDLQFTVHSMEAGEYKNRDVFSGGTQDQFLIALRLAFTQSILDSRIQADNYCLLMDECISSSDEPRKQGIFNVLEAMKNTFRQIFIIAHEDISNLVDYHLVLTRDENGYTQIRSKSW